MHTQNDGLEKVTPLNKWQFLVSMLDFWSVPFLAMGFTSLVYLVSFHGPSAYPHLTYPRLKNKGYIIS